MTWRSSNAVNHVRPTLGSCSPDITYCSPTVSSALTPRSVRFSVRQLAGEPIRVGLVSTLSRPRNPTHSNTPARVSECSNLLNGEVAHFFRLFQESHYRARGRARDGKCLITGMQTQTYSRLKVAHIFPRAHDVEVSHL
jgi:hypothetical protein